jgi:hypothetical protein
MLGAVAEGARLRSCLTYLSFTSEVVFLEKSFINNFLSKIKLF